MAEIPIHKKSGLAWLWVLLGLLVAALILWALLADHDSPRENAVSTADQTTAAAPNDTTMAGANGTNADTGAPETSGNSLMTAESVAAANRRSLERVKADAGATPRVFFQYDSPNLSDGARAVLDAALAGHPSARDDGMTLAGFADRAGPKPYNRELSEQRAKQARDYLVSKGIPADKIDVEGMGETPTLVSTGNDQREVLNRRVRLEFADAE